MKDDLQLVTTLDGSHTLFVPSLNEHYHSVNGALRESEHIFIESGFRALPSTKEALNLLEVGFGTGLNALLTLIAAREKQMKVNYIAIEPYPPEETLLAQLNYPGLVGSCDERILFTSLHRAPWNHPYFITDDFILYKFMEKIQDIDLQDGQIGLVYYDAFSPEVQPEMWEPEIMGRLFRAMRTGGMLLTYCAKGSVKRALKSAGFEVENLPGPPGKREITRGVKKL